MQFARLSTSAVVENIATLIPSHPSRMNAQVLNYVYVDGMAEKRGPHRADHLALARAAAAAGELLIGGPFEDMEHGLMLFTSSAAAERFAMSDPYVLNDLVPHFGIRVLSAAVGSFHGQLK